MHRHLITILAALSAAAATGGLAIAARTHDTTHARKSDDRAAAYTIGLWGDLPYSDQQKTVGVPNLIADMNSQRLAFTVHDGDIKAGGDPCVDSVYTGFKAAMNTLDAPPMFTPGDHDWTDSDPGPF